jgi:hypothetical protein
MIMRYWRGWTTLENADAYESVVSAEVLPAIAARRVAGYLGSYLLRRELGEGVEFATIMLLESIDAVISFAGADYETAYIPARAREVLDHFDVRSAHHDTLLKPDHTGGSR